MPFSYHNPKNPTLDHRLKIRCHSAPPPREPNTGLNRIDPRFPTMCMNFELKLASLIVRNISLLFRCPFKEQQSVTILYLRCTEILSIKELNLPSFLLGKLLLFRCSHQMEACAQPTLLFLQLLLKRC